MSKPELLSPVQDFVSLKAAIDAGADAIYFGVKELNMRIGAKNFELKYVKKVIQICHKNNVKAYFTLNTIIYDDEIEKVKKILKLLKKEQVDGIICWDYSVIKECEKLKLPIHLSTQAGVANFETILFLKEKIKNLKRVNLARELSLEQIKGIIKKIKENKLKIEIETFIHGAMCVSVSGRCFLSQEVFNKSANRGECLQPCRRKYLIKDVEENHEFELGEEYVMSPKDLCTIEIIDKLIDAGINSFKIEGRNRSPEYVKVVTKSYREAINNPKVDKKKLLKKLKTVYNRGFSTGFYLGKPMNEWSKAYGSKATKKKIYLGRVLNYFKKVRVAEILLETNDLKLNDTIMFQGNKTGVVEDKVNSIEIKNKKIKLAKKGQRVGIKIKNIVRENDKVFSICQK
jgi:putative protease